MFGSIPNDLAGYFANQIQQSQNSGGKMQEVAVGVVTDNKDPSKLGRVKVKIPVVSDTDASAWAPIVMLGGGKNRGWFFIPEVNDEVLVAFEQGDMHKPVVIGALWGGKDKPPEKNSGGNNKRVIKSREGGKITFDDTSGAEKLIFEDGKGYAKLTIDSVNNKIILETTQGDICFQSPTGDFKIVAQSIEMKATQNVEIHAGSTQAWGTDASATVKGQATTLAGAMVNVNCGSAQSPQAPTANPQDVADPYGS